MQPGLGKKNHNGERKMLYEVMADDEHIEVLVGCVWGPEKAELGNFASLTVLFLEENQLSGEIPAELGSLSNLVSLGLSNNELSGCVPSSLEDDLLLFDFSNLGGLPFC